MAIRGPRAEERAAALQHVDRALVERFWSKVDTNGPIPDHCPELGPCWLWTAFTMGSGYGRFGIGGRRGGMEGAHRVAYSIAVGPIPTGLDIDHLCRVPGCVRPSHLEAVTHQENNRRGVAGQVNGDRQRAITHCPRGHRYDEANTAWQASAYGGKQRRCRACRRSRR